MAASGEEAISQAKRWRLVVIAFLMSVCVKVLLFPPYRSTDFDVHRHWKAVTRHISSPREWYFDDSYVDTRHTLDYPPAFALLEFFWANNPLTRTLLVHHWLDESCLSLLPDPPNGALQEVSKECISFMRLTVIASDGIFWLGAYVLATSVATKTYFPWKLFAPLVLHPALLWLDHVHFQYNGMMIGIWLLSMACLLRANQHSTSETGWLLGSAASFACLLMLKHIYLTLAPWYTIYLFRRLCFQGKPKELRFNVSRFLLLGTVTLTCLLLPLRPFLLDSTSPHSLPEFLIQLFQRLFPFGRGLVHDYWAGNLWAFYAAVSKLHSLPAVTPLHTAVLLMIAQSPGLYAAWKAAAQKNNSLLMLSLTYVGAMAFFVSFHVHEKAILNTLIPLTVWTFLSEGDYSLWWECTAWGTFGLVPLLYEPRELLLKGASLALYLLVFGRMCTATKENSSTTFSAIGRKHPLSLRIPRKIHILLLLSMWVLVDMLPLRLFGRLEFVPLALTSLSCASFLAISFVRIAHHMLVEVVPATKRRSSVAI